MPIKVVEGSMNVLDAAITRVRNVFKNDCKIYLSFSSGKDSLCMASIVYDLIRAGEIDGTKLTVTFIDEEGLGQQRDSGIAAHRDSLSPAPKGPVYKIDFSDFGYFLRFFRQNLPKRPAGREKAI